MHKTDNFRQQLDQAARLEQEMWATLKVEDAETGDPVPFSIVDDELFVDSKPGQKVTISYTQNGELKSSTTDGKRTYDINGKQPIYKNRAQRRKEQREAARFLKKLKKQNSKMGVKW